jgi:DNA-binding NarL/FixJ family response regulator
MPVRIRTQRRAPGRARHGRPVGVLIADDQLVFRQVAREVVEATTNFELVAEATSGKQALAAAEKLFPDLILLDVRMPGMDGIETAARIHSAHPEGVIVLVSVEEPPNLPHGTNTCGAAEFVRKQDFGPATLRRVWATHGPGRAS